MNSLIVEQEEKQRVKIVNVKSWMLKLTELSPYELYIFAFIHNMTDFNGKGWVMQPDYFMDYLNLGTTQEDYDKFVDALNHLQNRDYIKLYKSGNTKNITFTSIFDEITLYE